MRHNAPTAQPSRPARRRAVLRILRMWAEFTRVGRRAELPERLTTPSSGSPKDFDQPRIWFLGVEFSYEYPQPFPDRRKLKGAVNVNAAALSVLAIAALVSLTVVIGGSNTEQQSATVPGPAVAPPPPEVVKDLGGVYHTESFDEGLQRAFERAPSEVDRDDLEIIENLYQNDLWKDSVDGVTFGAGGKVTEVEFRGSVPGAKALMEYAASLLDPGVEFRNVG